MCIEIRHKNLDQVMEIFRPYYHQMQILHQNEHHADYWIADSFS
jgi:hypothetical protein